MGDFTTRDGCRIHYEDQGSGPETLVLLTGWSQTRATFDRLLAALEPAGDRYRVVSWDYRNHGVSGGSDRGARIASLAADLRELLEHLGVDSAHFLGHSMGCSVLYSYVDAHGTGSVRSLVLVDQPSVCALVPWLAPEDASTVGAIVDFPGAYDFVTAVAGADGPAARRAFLESMIGPDLPPEDVDWLEQENLQGRMPFAAKLLLDHIMQDWRDVLPHLDVPTLVVGGEKSHVVPTSQEWIAGQIPGARLRVLTSEEGGSHFAFYEQPALFAELVTGFLDDAVAGRAVSAPG
ncbi:alpha/beta fold hydrolase [Lapillicoccus jejuensis]|uniref:Pimeloyl-ACP methyl ester carboxylesterase n=1 Tax=Lapillicoccus jejuensis TaxID=402171 RepID=A0A542DXL8_9MICO|nr:alpha/beta hydrolase [Lapillicoccus jejuensis]TQJ07828.1 pimeloyl-ACP methyl ester carboxylesterase [Lapillicoccus jejuensis]